MTVTLKQFELGLIDFIEKEIASKASGISRFLYFGASFVIAANIEKMISEWANNPMIKSIGFIDGDNNINLDAVYDAALYAIKKSGKFEVAGVLLDENDIIRLYDLIKANATYIKNPAESVRK